MDGKKKETTEADKALAEKKAMIKRKEMQKRRAKIAPRALKERQILETEEAFRLKANASGFKWLPLKPGMYAAYPCNTLTLTSDGQARCGCDYVHAFRFLSSFANT